MKNGFLTSEFLSQLLGPYGLAFVMLYMGLGDSETMALLEKAMVGMPAQLQALVLLAIKFGSIVGATLVGSKGAEATRSYNVGRAQLKLKSMGQPVCNKGQK